MIGPWTFLWWVSGKVSRSQHHQPSGRSNESGVMLVSRLPSLTSPTWRGFRCLQSSIKWKWSEVAQCVGLFATPWTVAYQVPPSMGFSRQGCWSGLSFPSPGDLPDSGIEPRSPALQADALLSEPPGKPSSYTYLLMGKQHPAQKLLLTVSPSSHVPSPP